MELEIGATYTVLRTDNTLVTFKFLGDVPPSVEINGVNNLLADVLRPAFLAYWKVQVRQ